jgi:hypothetical protein
VITIFDDDLPEGEPPPELLMSDFAARMLDVERQGSPLWLVDRAVLMLETDRLGPALTLLRELPGAIRGTAETIYAEGREMGRQAAQRATEKAARASAAPLELGAALRPSAAPGARPAASVATMSSSKPGRLVKVSAPAPGHPRQAAELRDHVERLGADRVAAVLRVAVADLEPMLAGRVKPSNEWLPRLRKTPS